GRIVGQPGHGGAWPIGFLLWAGPPDDATAADRLETPDLVAPSIGHIHAARAIERDVVGLHEATLILDGRENGQRAVGCQPFDVAAAAAYIRVVLVDDIQRSVRTHRQPGDCADTLARAGDFHHLTRAVDIPDSPTGVTAGIDAIPICGHACRVSVIIR